MTIFTSTNWIVDIKKNRHFNNDNLIIDIKNDISSSNQKSILDINNFWWDFTSENTSTDISNSIVPGNE